MLKECSKSRKTCKNVSHLLTGLLVLHHHKVLSLLSRGWILGPLFKTLRSQVSRSKIPKNLKPQVEDPGSRTLRIQDLVPQREDPGHYGDARFQTLREYKNHSCKFFLILNRFCHQRVMDSHRVLGQHLPIYLQSKH